MGDKKSNLEIYNELGQKVFSELPIVHYPLSINISNQPNGAYFVVLKTEQGEFKGKVILLR